MLSTKSFGVFYLIFGGFSLNVRCQLITEPFYTYLIAILISLESISDSNNWIVTSYADCFLIVTKHLAPRQIEAHISLLTLTLQNT